MRYIRRFIGLFGFGKSREIQLELPLAWTKKR